MSYTATDISYGADGVIWLVLDVNTNIYTCETDGSSLTCSVTSESDSVRISGGPDNNAVSVNINNYPRKHTDGADTSADLPSNSYQDIGFGPGGVICGARTDGLTYRLSDIDDSAWELVASTPLIERIDTGPNG